MQETRAGRLKGPVAFGVILGLGALVLALALSLRAAGAAADGALEPDWQGDDAQVTAALERTAWRSPAVFSEPPWTIESAEAEPGLQFPEGTTYVEAIQAIYLAAGQGRLPEKAAVVESLRPGKVVRPAGRGSGLVVSLTFPYGYDVHTGNIVTPIFEYISHPNGPDGHSAERELRTILEARDADDGSVPEGMRVAGSALIACQVDHPEVATNCDDSHVAAPLSAEQLSVDIGPVLVSGSGGAR